MSMVAQGGKIISNNLTLAKVYEVKDRGTNGFLMKNGASEDVIGLMSLAVGELMQMVDTNFTNETIVDTAMLITSEYPHHRPQELIIAIKNGLAGKYGKAYGKLTTMELMRWVKEYDETERAEYFEKKATEKPKADWKDIDPEIMKTPLSKITQPTEQKINKPTEWAQQILKDFDKEAKEISGKRWIEYKGFTLDVDEYLQLRFNEETNGR